MPGILLRLLSPGPLRPPLLRIGSPHGVSGVSYPHKGVEGGVRSDHNLCDTRLFYALAYSLITITDWPAKKNQRSSAKNIP